MKMKIFLIVLITASTLSAQYWQMPGQGPGGPGGMSRENMEAVRIWKMTEMLELTEDQVATFIPAMQIHERKIQTLQKKHAVLIRENQTLIERGNVNQKDVEKALASYTKLEKEIHAVKMEWMAKLPEYLSPEQQLRYLTFEAEFRKHLRRFIQDQRGSQPRGSGKR